MYLNGCYSEILLGEAGEMNSVQKLRDKATQYYRLARSVTSTRDIALFRSLGAEADQAADKMEAEETAQRAGAPAPEPRG
jgi:hypothetical protein